MNHSWYAPARLIRWKAFLASLMVLAMGLVPLRETPVWAQQKQQKVRELQSKKGHIESKRQQLQRMKHEKLREAQKYNTRMIQNQYQLEQERRSLRFQQQKLETTRQRLVFLDNRLDKTLGEATRLADDAGKRLRNLYMGERISMLQMILEANDISSLLDRIYYKKRIVAQDRQVLADLRQKINELNMLKKELASQKSLIAQAIQGIEAKNMQISQAIAMDRQLRDKYRNDASFYERAERQLLAESQAITSEIVRLTRNTSAKASVASTGSMIWPISGRVSSRFGYRTHPIHRTRLMHTGLDIAGPNGGAIRAADGGVVIFAGWKGGYGKAVMVNHGNRNGQNLVTLYGHMSGIAVAPGQTVSKGQTVGYEGSTGYATGPHLHFEVRVDGVPVDPSPYLR